MRRPHPAPRANPGPPLAVVAGLLFAFIALTASAPSDDSDGARRSAKREGGRVPVLSWVLEHGDEIAALAKVLGGLL